MQISIIIPMYNEERYIARCLESLTHQTFQDFEIILIDDGSTDKTVKIAETFKDNFHLTILKQQHGWPGKARNRWAKKAKGEILVFVDADMFFDQDYIKLLIEPIQNKKEIGTSHGTELVGNLENPIARAYGIIRGKYDPNHSRSNVYRMVKKTEFLLAGGFDPSKGYFDDDLSKLNKGKGSLSIEKAICYHNNPEKLREVFKHSIWVGKWLMESGQIKNYSKKYGIWILAFFLLWIIATRFCIQQGIWRLIPIIVLSILFTLILIKAVQRTFKEKYPSHLVYIPIVMSLRGGGYIYGIFKYFITKKR